MYTDLRSLLIHPSQATKAPSQLCQVESDMAAVGEGFTLHPSKCTDVA